MRARAPNGGAIEWDEVSVDDEKRRRENMFKVVDCASEEQLKN